MATEDPAPSVRKKQRREKPLVEQPPSGTEQDGPGRSKFAKCLGSTDYMTREQGLQSLSLFLTHKHNLTELDMLKIWKGLFYSFWHSDKAPVQQELAQRLAGLLGQMQPEAGLLYFRVFADTMRREWHGIDRLRLDKFMTLIRRFVGAMLAHLGACGWRPKLAAGYADALRSVLLPSDAHRAVGMAYHVSDLFLGELRAAAGGKQVPAPALQALLAPFCEALQRAGEQPMLDRLSGGLFDQLAAELAEPSQGAPLGLLDGQAFASALFDRGAGDGVKARNRAACYAASEALERAAAKQPGGRKAAGSSAGASAGNGLESRGQAAPAAAPRVGTPTANGTPSPAGGKAGGGSSTKKKRKAAAMAAEEAPPDNAARTGAQEGAASTPRPQAKAATPVAQRPDPATPGSHAGKRGAGGQQQQHGTPQSAGANQRGAGPAAGPSGSQSVPAKRSKHAPARTPGQKLRQPLQQLGLDASASKKGVRWDLRRNVYFGVGEPVPEPDIRTPPSAKPKGSALKARRHGAGGRSSLGGGAPGSAPPVLRSLGYDTALASVTGVEAAVAAARDRGKATPGGGAAHGTRRMLTPKSAPRARATDFF